MKKILLFNGCSFTAGDKVVYDQFCNEYPCLDESLKDSFYRWCYSKKYNLSAQCSNILNTLRLDLSIDGASNYRIALSTINYLKTYTPEFRKNFHVVIGWTEISRFSKFSEKYMKFMDVHPKYDHIIDLTPFYDFFKTYYGSMQDVDFLYNYYLNIFSLENYLKNNDITYTFFRAVGPPIYYLLGKGSGIADKFYKKESDVLNNEFTFDLENNWGDVSEFSEKYCTYPVIVDTNHDKWVNIDPKKLSETDNIGPPIVGHSWASVLDDVPDRGAYISPTNGHPNLDSIKQWASILSKKILEDI